MSDLISRQAAIETIEERLRQGDEVYPLTETDKITNHAFEIAASCVYNLPSAQQWIPCSERLPEKDGRYLTTNSMIGKWVVDWNIWYNEPKPSWVYNHGVIAWMPLPEPYEEIENEI